MQTGFSPWPYFVARGGKLSDGCPTLRPFPGKIPDRTQSRDRIILPNRGGLTLPEVSPLLQETYFGHSPYKDLLANNLKNYT